MIVIPGYQIAEKLHETTRTTLYRGYRQKDNLPVILKILNDAYPTPDEIARFKREYEITRSLSNDHIIKVYGLEHYKNTPVIVLEDFRGESLSNILTSRKLSLQEFLHLALRITEIVGEIHQHHIIHKDINPSNILWDQEHDQIKIVDFGISTVLSPDNPAVFTPNVLEATLAYMSPEQTGRMNRPIDYRSDFYSLGVTFYEMLVGFLPFQTTDPIELVHCHLAKTPKAPHELNQKIPKPVSEIVMKLMAKTAEERYQSVSGLKSDLQKCHEQLEFKGEIQYIAVGQDDLPIRFQLPQKLYGRAIHLKALLASYERVCQGKCELMLVSGEAGTGKSALIHELRKPIAENRGYFIEGSFEPFNVDTPYSAIIQAFQSLIPQILTERAEQLAGLKKKLRAAVGSNGGLVLEMVPDLEHLIGEQPAVTDLLPVESQNHLLLLLQKVIQAFAAPEHPLVIFLDDLQWADPVSLKWLQLLLTSPDSHALLVIGSYQENEITPEHPLLTMLNDNQSTGIIINRLFVSSLSLAELSLFLADTLHCEQRQVEPLTELILKKTGGNPLSVREFLKTLHKEGLLTFDAQNGGWQWNAEQIQGMAIAENVVDFMISKIQRLPSSTQQVLQFAACIGARFDLHTLALAQGIGTKAAAAELDAAIQTGLILPVDETYQYVAYFSSDELKEFASHVCYDFVHNRVQEALDAMISDDQRGAFHLSIGRHLLRDDVHKKKCKEHFAEIVNHLNKGAALIHNEDERMALAKLNLKAGQQAKAAAAHKSALSYLKMGMALLAKNGWQRHYDVTFQLYKERAEVEYLNGNFGQSGKLVQVLLDQARSPIEKAQIYSLLAIQATLLTHYAEALEAGRMALSLLGIDLPLKDVADVLPGELAQVKNQLQQREMTALLHEPEMPEPEKRVAIQILDRLIPSAFQSDQDLYRFIILKIVNLSLKYGHLPEEAFGYAQYGVLLGSAWGEYRTAYEFGLLAVKMSERFHNLAQRCKTMFSLASQLNCWVKPIRQAHRFEKEAYQAGLNAGELQYAGFTVMHRVMNLFYEGAALDQILANIPEFLNFCHKTQNQIAIDVITGCHLAISNLRGLTSEKMVFDLETISEEHYLAQCQKHHHAMALGLYQIMKAQVLALYGLPIESLGCIREAEKHLDIVNTCVARAVHNFYHSLNLVALYPTVPPEDQKQYWDQLTTNQVRMKVWAENCPENFQHAYLLIQAEKARLTNKPFAAMKLYKQAIKAAEDHGFIQCKALAHELAGKFYLDREFEEFAALHLKMAHYDYILWGAQRKAQDLEEQYPQFLAEIEGGSGVGKDRSTTRKSTKIALQSTEKGLSVLDLQTFMKASQAISREIVLAELLKQMMAIVIENAGAQKGWLLLDDKGNWMIVAEGSVDDPEVKVLQSIPIGSEGNIGESLLPTTLIHAVIRTSEPLVFDDATQEGDFTHDPYIVKHQCKSVLCFPLIKQKKLVGIVYLENNLTRGAFTSDRLDVLHMLSSQMATSIENAMLYKELEEALAYEIELSTRQHEVTTAYSRFVPSEFLRLLGKESIVDVRLGEQIEKEITVMFCDIRDFTALSEKMTPQENFNFINSYLSQMSPVIHKHHGFIDKYIGDAIMALFPTNADDAVQAAIAMLTKLEEYNHGRQRAGYYPIKIGIGLNTGVLMLGTVGDQHRMDGTVISDAVNLASRIEQMTKEYGASLLISETTYFQLKDVSRYSIRIIDQVQAKGKSEPVTIFEVFDGDPPDIAELKRQTLMLFKQGFKLYHQTKFAEAQTFLKEVLDISEEEKAVRIADAKELFDEVLHINSYDKAAQVYRQRCERYLKYGIAEEWVGIWSWFESLKKKK